MLKIISISNSYLIEPGLRPRLGPTHPETSSKATDTFGSHQNDCKTGWLPGAHRWWLPRLCHSLAGQAAPGRYRNRLVPWSFPMIPIPPLVGNDMPMGGEGKKWGRFKVPASEDSTTRSLPPFPQLLGGDGWRYCIYEILYLIPFSILKKRIRSLICW